ncbi:MULTISPECIES: helix-turn-helix domain-containing protein [unclassified Nostoc]|uniref:helix-turn-helix domain-containing protein n=1 Tax=unclassified Nostoc TaxID=2593658 RepID=UPI0025F16A6B|nr:helix-turn-helix domain-containing protein [Nostoc sp. JL33]MBN3870427.1 helix-turn-helix domain-containing protein [Nostoc sp. JL33]
MKVFLNEEEKLTLEELRKAKDVPQRTKDRAQVLLLNARGLKNEHIAKGLNWAISTVRQTLHRWEKMGLAGLWDAPGRGGKPRYSESDLVYLENCLAQEPQTYNSKQLAKKLASERQVSLSADRLRRVLKKRGRRFGSPRTQPHKQNKPLAKILEPPETQVPD